MQPDEVVVVNRLREAVERAEEERKLAWQTRDWDLLRRAADAVTAAEAELVIISLANVATAR